ncbi:hypothetical protein MMC12_004300 [Toensbergia leucococca]|nr:hypothetical protein [Toensbergia leucococca]
MLHHQLLERWYQGYDPLQQSYAITAQWIRKCFSHQVPHMKVLEIGAGTGSCTIPLLEALNVGDHPLLSRYTFTDISAGFFGRARDRLKRWGELIEYVKLDIGEDPTPQGFDVGSYNLVVASYVLHCTTHLDHTMKNVRKLLKDGGKVLFIEITNLLPTSTALFGTLPGWWVSDGPEREDSPTLSEQQWNDVLL